jgi:hypothetical protein
MSLEDELILIQFAQGLHPEANLMDNFMQLDETRQNRHLFGIMALLQQLKLTDSEIEQANARSSSETASNSFLIRRNKLSKAGLQINMVIREFNDSYHVLLDLFKDAYQLSFNQENESSDNWIYQDLSNSDTVQGILTQRDVMVEDLYSSTSFRSEFVSLAKVWHKDSLLKEELYREPAPVAEPQTYVDFLSYDELITTLIPGTTISKETKAIDILLNSLRKAASMRYKLDSDQANRIVLDVLRRHLREMFNMQLDW